MRRLAGFIFDQYDDVEGAVLRSAVPHLEDLPEIIKTASRMNADERDQAPDEQFALVLFDQGNKLKKFASTNAGETALSVLYLLKQAHHLPPAAVKIAASNLVAACQEHDLDVPMALKVAAMTGTSALAKKMKLAEGVSQGQALGDHQLGNADGANDDVDQRTNLQGVQGENVLKIPLWPNEKEKVAHEFEVRTKQKSWRTSPYFDASSWDPNSGTPEPAAPQRTLMEGSYPVDGYDQIKTAAAFFEEKWQEFEPRKRHKYCVKLATRMEKVGMAIPAEVARYGSTTYSADVDSYLGARRSWVSEEFYPALDTLIEKRAQISPETFAEALCEFDNMSGLRWQWDSNIADPWASTFGPSREKLAEEDWSYTEDGLMVWEDDLVALSTNGRKQVKAAFGEDFAKEFQKKPKDVFKSLPAPNKLILARMAFDRTGAGETL